MLIWFWEFTKILEKKHYIIVELEQYNKEKI